MTFTFFCVAFRLLAKEVFMPFSKGEVLQDIIPTSKVLGKLYSYEYHLVSNKI